MFVCLVGDLLLRSSFQSSFGQAWHFLRPLPSFPKGKNNEAYSMGMHFYGILLGLGSISIGKCSLGTFALEGSILFEDAISMI